MIAQNGSRLKVERSKRNLTSFAGLPLLSELAHQLGLVKELDALPGLWERHGAFGTSDYVLGLAMTLIAGGESLSDTRLLHEDPGVAQLIMPSVPAPNSYGEFLRRFDHAGLHHLGAVNSRQVRRQLKRQALKRVTLDIDSSLIEADKKAALRTYKGFDGYNPLIAWLAEPDLFLAGVFRPGNASPQSHQVSLLRHCLQLLPPDTAVRLRADSAAYRLDVMQLCVDNQIEFTITADLDQAVREAVEEIPDSKWQLVVRGNDIFLLAETVHAPGSNSKQTLPAFRLVVSRRLSGQLELFKDPIKYHPVITSLPYTFSAEQVFDHHNDRGKAEKAIGELKNGFGLDRLPCGQLKANAAFFQVGLLAYNLVQIFKACALPTGWKKFCIKNLRFRLLCQAALVVRHAGQWFLKLSRSFPFFDEFRNARWAVLAPEFSSA